MRPVLLILTIVLAYSLISCSKTDRFVSKPYQVEPTLEITTNYIRIVDQLGWYMIDTGRTDLNFFNFYTIPTIKDILDSLAQKQQSALNGYYCTNSGVWTMRYLASVNLANTDSLKLRESAGSDFQEQTLTLTIDSSFLGKPLFELYHQPSNTVYARYIPDRSGTKLVLKFSGPRNSGFDTLSTKAIIDQFNYKLKPSTLGKHLYSHSL